MTDDEIREYLVQQSEGLKHLLVDLEKRLGAPTEALTSLPQQDDWSTVIKCHALIEGAVSGQEFRTKHEAVSAAKERVRGQEPSQVKVHKADGNMEYERAYGDDPSPPRG